MLGAPASDPKPAPASAENKLAAGVELKLNGVKLYKSSTAAEESTKKTGTSYAISTQIRRNEVYTIVGEEDGWGKLKSGAGWIYLAYTAKR